PIDNANVKSCVVTIAEIRADGKKIEGFSKSSLDLLAYQNGRIKNIGNVEVDAKSYTQLELILDHDVQENMMPGCYIEENDGTVHILTESDLTIQLDQNYNVEENGSTEVLLDFDLRKCVAQGNGSSSSEFKLVSETELKSGVRFTSENNRSIKGNCNDALVANDKVIVYAYAKGTYDREKEMRGQGSSNISFFNAVHSAPCDENGDFELHFMNEGEYELYFMAYDREANGSLRLKGSLEVNALSVLSPVAFELTNTANVEINVIATGLIGL
ncbi:MAG: DUF4382 domain-containing protein, partial [Saprospiraceae bacterium]|nr:DUF4382 domain-containing protein [Saprospiraceae bacterium]